MKKAKSILLGIVLSSSTLPQTVWAQQYTQKEKLVGTDRGVNDYAGYALGTFKDGYLLGAPYEDADNGGAGQGDAGCVFSYVYGSNAQLLSTQKLQASDYTGNDFFGYSIDVDQSLAVIGAHKKNNGSTVNAGAAYVFQKDSTGQWTELQKLVASDGAANDWFGWDVTISGNIIAVGAINNDFDANGGNTKNNSGAVYVFEPDTAGVWIQTAKLTANNRSVAEYFGNAIALHGDQLAVGAKFDAEDAQESNGISRAGSVHIFERIGSGMWNAVQKIVPQDRASSDEFGYAVSIWGNRVAVGAIGSNTDSLGLNGLADAGGVYVFDKDSLGTWTETQKLVASDRAANDQFGWSIDLRANTLVIGSPKEDVNIGGSLVNNAGAAYYFEENNNHWNETSKMHAEDGETDDWFGWDVKFNERYIFVGAINHNLDASGGDALANPGAGYVLCPAYATTIQPVSCDNYTAPDGQIYQTSGTYTAIVPSSINCDSTITINLTVDTIDITIGQVSGGLSSNEPGATYQWVDCANGNAPLTGETNQTLLPSQDGTYAVLITKHGCTEISACATFTALGQMQSFTALKVYPQPAQGSLCIEGDHLPKGTRLMIYDLQGKLHQEHTVEQTGKTELDLNLPNGVYLLKLQHESGQLVRKIHVKR